MKNQTIRNRYAALAVLADRVLPSPTALNKVATLLATRFAPAYEATELGRKNILKAHPLPHGWDDEKGRPPMYVAEARQHAIDEYLQQAQPIKKVPDRLRLTSADLPKKLEREDGEKNAEGLAQIRVWLGSLYAPSEDEKLDEATDESEAEE